MNKIENMKRKYDAEFKRNAVQKVLDGQSAARVTRELGISENLIYRWKKDFLENGDGQTSGVQLSEVETLKKRNRELEMELEILKKAALIFGREK
jgi:transposase